MAKAYLRSVGADIDSSITLVVITLVEYKLVVAYGRGV